MIFGTLKLENKVQTNDKTRLDATSTYLSPDEADITLVEIEPDTSVGFINVTENKYLDWQYSTSGDKTVSLRVTTDGPAETFTSTLTIVTPEEDNLFSGDADLTEFEDDILTYVRDGRDSFLDKHRAAQEIILDNLDSAMIWKDDGTRYTAADIVDIQDFRRWSKFLTLSIIFESLSNAIDDVFDNKATKYQSKAIESKSRATLRLDRNGDGNIDVDNEVIDIKTGILQRR